MGEIKLLPLLCKDCGEPVGGDAYPLDRGGYVCGACKGAYDRCDRCGRLADVTTTTIVGDDKLCGDCLERLRESGEIVECDECGELAYASDSEIIDGYDLCDSCYRSLCDDAKIVECHDCEEEHFRSEMTCIGGKYFCESCAEDWTKCDCCNDAVRRDDARRTAGGDWICEYCYDDYYFTCPGCGGIYHNDCGCYNERRDATYCESCDPGEPDEVAADEINDYHAGRDAGIYSPCRCAGKGEMLEPLLGVELEMVGGRFVGDDYSRWTEDGLLVHFERDGSLRCGGGSCCEMISQPCTLKFHEERMDWPALLGKCVERGFVSHQSDCCGLHVHVDRDSFEPSGIVKLDYFVNHCADFFRRVARRESSSFAAVDPYKKVDISKSGMWRLGKKELHSCCSHDGRYVAVNTTNIDTVEIRIFRGSLLPETVLGTLELVHALVRLVRVEPVGEIVKPYLNAIRLVDFIGEERKLYPNCVRMMARLLKDCDAEKPNADFWAKKLEIENDKKKGE